MEKILNIQTCPICLKRINSDFYVMHTFNCAEKKNLVLEKQRLAAQNRSRRIDQTLFGVIKHRQLRRL